MSLVNQSIIKHKMGLLHLAEELLNVSQAGRVMGVSRDTFYRVKEAKETGGMEREWSTPGAGFQFEPGRH